MDKAWTTGITVCNTEDGWSASCDWQLGKHMESGCIEGTIGTKYYEKLIMYLVVWKEWVLSVLMK